MCCVLSAGDENDYKNWPRSIDLSPSVLQLTLLVTHTWSNRLSDWEQSNDIETEIESE